MTNADEAQATLGVTPRGSENIEELMETGWFAEERDVFRLAVSIALSEGIITEASSMGGKTTKWNRQTLDGDLRLRELVQLMAPSEDHTAPYKYAERLADAGLEYLNRRLNEQHRGLGEVLKSVGRLSSDDSGDAGTN